MTAEEKEKYFQVALATSLVLFGFDGTDIYILLYQKRAEPFKDFWMLPSAYLLPNENLELLLRSIVDKYNSDKSYIPYLEQLKAFAKATRNPEGRVVNVAFYALIKLEPKILEKTLESTNKKWVKLNEVGDLAYDHNDIIKYAKERLGRRVKRRPVGFHLLAREFTINQLQTLYEKALDKELDKRNFRKKIFNSQLIIETEKTTETGLTRKVSKLYRFDADKYEKMTLKGYDFLF